MGEQNMETDLEITRSTKKWPKSFAKDVSKKVSDLFSNHKTVSV
jgi:hypothetical protein